MTFGSSCAERACGIAIGAMAAIIPRWVAAKGPSTAPIGNPVIRMLCPSFTASESPMRSAGSGVPADLQQREVGARVGRDHSRFAKRSQPRCPAAESECRTCSIRLLSSGPGSTCALVTTSVPSSTTKPVPRNENCGVRVRSNVPTATTDCLTRSMVAKASSARAGAGNTAMPVASSSVSAPARPRKPVRKRDHERLTIPAAGLGSTIGDGSTMRASYGCRSWRNSR